MFRSRPRQAPCVRNATGLRCHPHGAQATPAYIWSINGIAGGNDTVGTIVGNGNYLAPNILPKANTITVTATSVADTTATGNATMTLGNPVPILSTVTPVPRCHWKVQSDSHRFGLHEWLGGEFRFSATDYDLVSPTELTATGTATIAQVGTVNVSVTNPNPVSATSAPIPVQVVASSNIVVTLTPNP